MGTGNRKEGSIKRPLRILHITSSLGIGGAESVLYYLIKHLQSDAEHMVIAFHDGPYREKLHACGIQVIVLRGLVVRYDPIFFIKLFWHIKQIQPDCIHSLLWAANVTARIIGRMLAIPVISAMHNNVSLNGRLRNYLDSWTLSLAKQVVVIHEGVQQSIIDRCRKHARLPITIIHNCIDIDDVQRLANANLQLRSSFDLRDDHFVIGAVGRWIPIKRYSLLIEQFAYILQAYPHARLLLIGHGPQAHTLREQVRMLGIDHAVRFIAGKQAYGYFPLFNCFVLPSITEGPSIALLEAMSFGVPPVVTREELDHPVIVSGKNGILVSAGDANALYSALVELITNSYLRKKMGIYARQTIERDFSIDRMVDAYKKIFYDSIL